MTLLRGQDIKLDQDFNVEQSKFVGVDDGERETDKFANENVFKTKSSSGVTNEAAVVAMHGEE